MSSDVERKRSVDETAADSKRRKVYDELSDSGPLTQEDVKYFRKQAIWRQMKFYKDKYMMLEKEINAYKARASKSEDLVSAMDVWYEQLVKLLPTDGEIGQAINEDILILLEDEKLNETLKKRRDHLLQILSPVLEKGAATLEDKNLLKKVTALNSSLGNLRQENMTLARSKQELESRIDEITNKYLKQAERQASSTIERVHNLKKEEIKQEPDSSATPAPSEVNDKEFKDLKEQVQHVERINQAFEQKFKQYLEEKGVLIKELAALKAKGVSHQESNDIELETLKQDNKSFKTEIHELRDINEKLRITVKDLELKQNNLVSMINEDVLAENTNLKEQLTKLESDLVRIRNMRDDLLSKQQILEKSQPSEELLKMNQNLLTKISLSDKQLEGNELAKELEGLYKELATSLHAKLLSKVDQENLIKKYQIEKTKADQKYFQIMRLKDALTNENKILKLQNTKSQEVISKLNELEKGYIQKFDKLTSITSGLKETNDKLRTDKNTLNKSIQVNTFEKTKLANELNELKQENSRSLLRESSVGDQVKQKEMEIVKLQSKLTKYERLMATPNGSANLHAEELDGFRSMVKCSVCSKNWKNTVLTVCGHAFCSECTKERLNARLRRCPTCNKGFSANDLLSIHL